MMHIGVLKLRSNLAEAINTAAFKGERVILERHGKPVAAMVSIEDLQVLETVENREDNAGNG